MQSRRNFLRTASALGALPLFNVLGCRRTEGPASAPNIVLLVMDTVRADHVGCFGATTETTPSIDAFAQNATIYRRAFSTAPWTIPAHSSMFTGKFSFEHGAHAYKGLDEAGSEVARVRPLDKRHETLAELLRHEGFKTGAVCANLNFKGRDVLQGFEEPHVQRMTARGTNRRVLDWLDGARVSPFFLFVNYIDAHKPYNTEPVEGANLPPAPRDRGLLDEFIQAVLATDRPIPQILQRKLILQYDNGIRNIDEGVAGVLAKLEEKGVYDETLIIVVSDHGECFGEHRLAEHCLDVYNVETHVPLIVKFPGQSAGTRVDTPISLADLPRLILSALPERQGRRLSELFPYAPGSHPVLIENYLMGDRKREWNAGAYGGRFDRERVALVDWPYKFISTSTGLAELYDLAADPGELANLMTLDERNAARYAEDLKRFLESRRAYSGGVEESIRLLSPQDRDDLEALGYLD